MHKNSSEMLLLQGAKQYVLLMLIALIASSLTACYRAPGPFESAGRQLDRDIEATEASAERIGASIDVLIDEIERALENSGNSIDRTL